MSTLHMLSHSPFTDSRLDSCLRLLGEQDAIILCGDAVYALQPGCKMLVAVKNSNVFALEEDLQARGLQAPEGISSVDYAAFVELSLHYDKVNTWL